MPWTQKQMLRDANGDLIPQYWDVVEQEFKPLTGQGGANDVRLTGRNVEEVIFFDALAITDTGVYTSDIIDLSKYEKVLFVAINTHDQPIDLWFQIAGGNVYFWDGSSYVHTSSRRIKVPGVGQINRIILNDAQPETLNKFYFDTVRWTARANDTPTSGSLTIKAWGVVS